jgi:hypothetical protein
MSTAQVRVTRAAYLGVLAAGFAAMLVANLPGHLTLDSILELYEGRFRIRQSWAPSFYAWVLGAFDAVRPGTGLYVVVSALLLFAAIASFAWLRGRLSGWAVAAAALFVVSPLVVIYQAVVWKDVLFANAAVAGMVLMAWAARPGGSRWAKALQLAAALALLAAAALVRQNGVLVGVVAVAALGWTRARGSWRRGLGWGAGALVALVVTSHAMDLATRPDRGGGGMSEGMRVLQSYDLLGALALDKDFPLSATSRARPAAAATLRSLAPRYYSAERTDYADGQPQIQQALAQVPTATLATDWRTLVLGRPGLYLRERAAVFRWVMLTPRIDRCLPVALGVQGPEDVLGDLGLRFRWSDQDDRLLAYNRAFTGTPVYSHLAYALLALGVGLVLLRRRDAADIMIIAMLAGALGFAASFFVISIACDYRYLYLLDLAAMAGLVYVAVDPPGARPSRDGGCLESAAPASRLASVDVREDAVVQARREVARLPAANSKA